MRVWVYEKKGWPCVVSEDELEQYKTRRLVVVFDSDEETLPLVEAMQDAARARRSEGSA
jgi:hypothetical protein